MGRRGELGAAVRLPRGRVELQAAVYLDTSPPVAGFLQVSELKVVI
jgi:hypothetical protein